MIKPEVFKQVRTALGLTQQELADAIGLSRVTINKMEQGRLKRGIPDEIAARLMALKRSPLTADQKAQMEMERALRADGEKLRQLTGEDHGPYFINDNHLWDNEEDDS